MLVQTSHMVLGDAHEPPPVHTPPEHVWPVGQRFPHDPQLTGLMVTSTQTAPHICCGAVQVEAVTHEPLLHVWPVEQRFPHVPQLVGSLEVNTQLAPHICCGDTQVGLVESPLAVGRSSGATGVSCVTITSSVGITVVVPPRAEQARAVIETASMCKPY